MSNPLAVGDPVQTALGKGIVREIRRHGRLLVEVKGRPLELDAGQVTRVDAGAASAKRQPQRREPESRALDVVEEGPRAGLEIDLHGLTVDEALARVDREINDAMVGDRAEIRFIHGRSGGRIRGALHQRLRAIPTVRAFHLDPRNPGVTVVVL